MKKMVAIMVVAALVLVCYPAGWGSWFAQKEAFQSEEWQEESGEMGLSISGEEEIIPEIIVEEVSYVMPSHPELAGNTPYYIMINNAQNVVTIFAKDVEENYTEPVKAMICSIGDATPSAGKTYKVTSYKREWNALQGNVYGQYATQIVGNILFHSVPYTAKRNNALEYWEYDKLGTAASLGCVRLTVEDAKWIYDNIVAGTVVEFYEDENPGPLGKPEAIKISDNEACRDWDPTDMVDGNPWRNVPTE